MLSFWMHRHTILAHLKNGSCETTLIDDPTIIVPQVFNDCRELWDRRGKRQSWPKDQWAFVRASVQSFLYATIDPEDVHYDNGLMNPRGTIRAQSVELTSVSFEKGPIPIISAYAQFMFSFDRRFRDNAEFYDWMKATDWLDWATNYGWRFTDRNEFDAAETHDGIEVELLVVRLLGNRRSPAPASLSNHVSLETYTVRTDDWL